MAETLFYASRNLVGIGSVGIGTTAPTANLHVTGNVFATTFNATTLNSTGIVAAGLHIGNASALSNLNASNLAFGNIQGYVVYGNTLSNIQASNIVGLNVVYGNTLSNLNASNLAFGNIQGYVVYGNTLSNLNASNLAFGNIQGYYVYGNTLSNIQASNIVGLVTVAGNTLSNLNASNLAFGNIQGYYVYGNTLSNIQASNITQPFANLVSGTIYYSEDLVKRAPHLIPTVANAAIIQAWISATCNVIDVQGSFWAPSSRPAFANVATGPVGSGAYAGSVSLPDGRILFVPYNATTVGIFNPFTNQFSSVTPATSLAGIAAPRFYGGVAVPSGNVIFIPYTSSNIGSYNPTTGAYANVFKHNISTPAFVGGVLDGQSNVTMIPYTGHSNICAYNGASGTFANMVSTGTTLGFSGAVLLPTGNIMCIPYGTSNIVQYSPTDRTYSNSTFGATTLAFIGGVLAPNGNVICIPYTNANVVVVNPSGNPPYAFSNISTGGGGFAGGVLLPSGNIACVSFSSSNSGMIDPGALTFSNIVPQSGAGPAQAYVGGSISVDGRVVFCPFNSTNVACLTTTTPCVPELRLAPYFNKL